VTVSRDALSGEYCPANAAECTELLAGSGIANPSIGLLCQELSGSLLDVIGSFNFAMNGSGGVNYAQPVSGRARKAVVIPDGTARFFANSDAGLPNIGAASLLAFGWVSLPASSGATDRSIITFGPTFGSQVAANLLSSKWKGYADPNGIAGTANPMASVRPLIVQCNRANTSAAIQTNQETITPTLTATPTGKHIRLGGDNAQSWLAGGVGYLGLWVWFNAAAELTPPQRATLIDRFLNGPPSGAPGPQRAPQHLGAFGGIIL
jgi:hypothetical protein